MYNLRQSRSLIEDGHQLSALENKRQLLARASAGCASLLRKRKNGDTLGYKDFLEKLSAKDTINVPAGEQKFQSFEKKGAVTMGTDGFDGCIGIVISSPKGGIIAHYTSTPEGTKEGKKDLTALIKKHKDSFKPAESEAWIYANVSPNNHNKFLNGEQKDTFVKLVKDETGISPRIEKYLQTGDMLDLDSIDIDGEDKEIEKQRKKLKGGAILLQNEGGGKAASVVTFVGVADQTAKKSCPK